MILTVDVDHFPGSETGIERVLGLLERKEIKATFFVAGKFAEEQPSVIKEISSKGHEIGCHGYSHGLDIEENFSHLNFEEQRERIEKSTSILKEIVHDDITLFRGPYGKANGDTLRALEDLSYRIDSSVTSRRFDFGMGVSNSIRALFAPSRPYHPSRQNIYKKGDSAVLEVPISAFFAPLTLSAIRTLGMGKVRFLFKRVSRSFDPVVFYLHPWEVMENNEIILWEGLPRRHSKNRGKAALQGLEEFIDFVEKKVRFVQFRDVAEVGRDDEGQ